MSHKPQISIATNVDLTFSVQDEDGVDFPFGGASSVKLSIVSIDRTVVLAGPYDCTDGYASSDWSAAIGAVALVGLETSTIQATQVAIEVKMVLAGKPAMFVNAVPIAAIRSLIP